MIKRILEWMGWKWGPIDPKMVQSYQVTFSTDHGRRVLNHLMDTIYCSVYEGSDPIQMATHNGMRSVVDLILRNVDAGEHPYKYNIKVEGVEDGIHS